MNNHNIISAADLNKTFDALQVVKGVNLSVSDCPHAGRGGCIMKKLFSLFIIGVALLIAPTTSFSENPVQIDVLYLNHGPMQPTLRELRALFPEYGNKIMVSWYNFESDEGQRFKSKMGISHHIPLVIWVDGRSELMNNGRIIKFQGFPTGSGPSFFQGKWKLADLASVLDHVTGRN